MVENKTVEQKKKKHKKFIETIATSNDIDEILNSLFESINS